MYMFRYKSIRNQIWPCRKKVKVNRRSSFEQTLSPMLQTKPQAHLPFSSREEDF